MNKEDMLSELRIMYVAAPKEEKQTIKITALAIEKGEPMDVILKRYAAHQRRHQTKNYEV